MDDRTLADELAEDIRECIDYAPGWAAGKWIGIRDYEAKWRDIMQALVDVYEAAQKAQYFAFPNCECLRCGLSVTLDRARAVIERTDGGR